MKNPLSIIFIISLFLQMYSCKTPGTETKTFSGDEKAVALAEQMFKAIGGKDAWCELKSLYIKAEHTEPQMTIPYQSEIWRAIDRFELVIEQQNDSFHVKGVVHETGGTIKYYDKRDTIRTLTEKQLKGWAFDHQHNVYVLLHKLGCKPEDYTVRIDKTQRLAFYRDSVFLTSFGLDDQLRPYLFYKPNPDGTVSGSKFTHWDEDNGLIHSAGGHPLDSNFMYRTQVWQPSGKPLKEMFGADVFDIQ